MYIHYFFFAVAAALSGCGVVLVITSWLRRNKDAFDWAMAVGSLCALMGAIGLAAALAEIKYLHSEESVLMIAGIGTMGVIIFTMGFAMDRMKYYRKEKADEYRSRVLPPET